MSFDTPVGVFDSGVGGLSVLQAIRVELPAEHLLYVADSAHCPYGDRTEAYILARAREITRFLLDAGAKAVVVACNTATAAAIAALRAEFRQPIVAMEPAVKPAVMATRSRIVGVLATAGTLGSRRFAQLIERYGEGVSVITQPCPGLVELVERGELTSSTTRLLLERYTRPLLERGADTLILGCTHYPFLRPVLSELVGPDVAIIDSGPAVARQLRRVLSAEGLLRVGAQGQMRYWTSGEPAQLAAVVASLGGEAADVAVLPEAAAPVRRGIPSAGNG